MLVTEPAVLNAKATGQYLGISESMVRKIERAGQLQAVRIGARVVFRRQDLDAYLERLRDES